MILRINRTKLLRKPAIYNTFINILIPNCYFKGNVAIEINKPLLVYCLTKLFNIKFALKRVLSI